MRWYSRLVLIALFCLLVLPLIMAAAVSFGAGDKVAFPPAGLSLRWYVKLFEPGDWRDAMVRSLAIAAMAASLSVSLALPIGYYVWRRPGWLSNTVFGLSLSPFLLPPIILAIGAVAFWIVMNYAVNAILAAFGQPSYFVYGKMYTTVLSHGVFLLPLASLIIARGFSNLSQEVIEAGRTLGAGSLQLFGTVILPLILPFIVVGFVMVFIVSLNEYLIAFQVAGVSVETLPIRIFNDATRGGHSPILTAGAVVFAGVTVLALLIVSFFTDLLKLFGSNA